MPPIVGIKDVLLLGQEEFDQKGRVLNCNKSSGMIGNIPKKVLRLEYDSVSK